MGFMPVKKIMRVLAVFILTAILVVWVLHEAKGRGEAPAGVPVTAAVVTAQTIDSTVKATGKLSAVLSASISPQVSGLITKIYFREGQSVNAGDPLVQLNDAIAQAQLVKAQAQLSTASATYQRQQELLAKHLVSQQDYAIAEAAWKSSQADVAAAQAAVNNMLIKAPFSGVVGAKLIDEGNNVTVGQSITTLVQPAPLSVNFSVPQEYSSKIELNQKVDINKGAFQGVVTFIAPAASDAYTINEVATIDSPGPLKPGFFVEVTQHLNDPLQVLSVPEESLTSTITGQNVYKIDMTHHTVSLVPVELKRLENVRVGESEKPMAYVTGAGLKAGDSVVTTGLQSLKPGSVVNIQKDG